MEKTKKCQFCDQQGYSEDYPFCDDHMLEGMGEEPYTCSNCGRCPAFCAGEAWYPNIKQASWETCGECGVSTWYVSNRCRTCQEDKSSCPTFIRKL